MNIFFFIPDVIMLYDSFAMANIVNHVRRMHVSYMVVEGFALFFFQKKLLPLVINIYR
mgnify:CR=1 FL=1